MSFVKDVSSDIYDKTAGRVLRNQLETIRTGAADCHANAKEIDDNTDPAYAEILTDMPFFTLINAVLTKNKDGAVDWDMAAGTDGTSGTKSAYVALRLLGDAQHRFLRLATAEEPSQSLKEALETAIEVAAGLQDEVDKSVDAAQKFPEAGSEVVTRWQRSFTDAYTKEIYPPVCGCWQPPGKRPSRVIEQQRTLGDIQAEVKELGGTKRGLEEIKAIVVRCIELIVEPKQQMMNQCTVFFSIDGTVENVLKYAVTPFFK
ncbi:hypothetical protein N657DRAFT_684186 [Parathielavia appendiculata]|uniref:Uncharacterized protein n=1 Tax=Parathielavia appendiculata TaxID=2587402 RepID=A0AAN6TS18_9PEZI|nr:hypothetical protein N657DRAFT_684186 [Parathielavia appendiculata]